MFRMIFRTRLGVWLGTMGAALLATVGFAQWSPPAAAPSGLLTPQGGAATMVPTAEPPEPAASVGTSGETAGEPFVNPEQVAREFCRRLAALVQDGNVVAPRELARQVARETTFPMQPLAASSDKLSAEQLYSRAKASVVIVGGISPCPGRPQWHGSFATGFVARKDGVILTNSHVIEAFAHTRAIGIMTDDGRVFPVTAVLAADRKNDVAAVKVEADDLIPLPIAAGVPIGSTIYCLSHPSLDCGGMENAFWTFTSGIVSGKLRLRLDGRELVDALAITADYAQGSSGGPILNEQGAVVGMVCHTMSLCADGDPGSMQMTWKLTRPSGSILQLLGSKATVASAAPPPATRVPSPARDSR